jgi:hypothetical protein
MSNSDENAPSARSKQREDPLRHSLRALDVKECVMKKGREEKKSVGESLNNMHDRNILIISDKALRILCLTSSVNRNGSVKPDCAGNIKTWVNINWLLSPVSWSTTRWGIRRAKKYSTKYSTLNYRRCLCLPICVGCASDGIFDIFCGSYVVLLVLSQFDCNNFSAAIYEMFRLYAPWVSQL